jgi:predicted nucleic-acid-binding Zn-ribbon protein
MKNTGTCPKCQSKEVYTDKGLPKRGERSSLPISSWSRLFVDLYICLDCGYFEEYVEQADLDNEKKMNKLKEMFGKHVI